MGRLRLKRCGSTPALKIFVVYAPTSNYDEEEVEAFYMDLERFYREDHTFFKVIIGDINAKIGPRRSSEERQSGTHGLEWNEQGERLSEFIMATKTIHGRTHGLEWNEQGERLSEFIMATKTIHGKLAIPEASPSTMDVGISQWRVP
uniref:Endo/exonuclease/phosphatase domain-containing protein n=1 Tax=Angiostrongylus cantonensis TaxID=6313 RepID=A0A0K0CZY0_ANGCA